MVPPPLPPAPSSRHFSAFTQFAASLSFVFFKLHHPRFFASFLLPAFVNSSQRGRSLGLAFEASRIVLLIILGNNPSFSFLLERACTPPPRALRLSSQANKRKFCSVHFNSDSSSSRHHKSCPPTQHPIYKTAHPSVLDLPSRNSTPVLPNPSILASQSKNHTPCHHGQHSRVGCESRFHTMSRRFDPHRLQKCFWPPCP